MVKRREDERREEKWAGEESVNKNKHKHEIRRNRNRLVSSLVRGFWYNFQRLLAKQYIGNI